MGKRYGFEEGQVTIKWEVIKVKGQSAQAQAEMLKTKLLKGIAVRSAALSIINTVMKFDDATGKKGVRKPLPDAVDIPKPKEEDYPDVLPTPNQPAQQTAAPEQQA